MADNAPAIHNDCGVCLTFCRFCPAAVRLCLAKIDNGAKFAPGGLRII